MLYIRLSHGKALTWEHIVEALESNTVGGNKLAEDIRNKYIKPQPASSEELVGENDTSTMVSTTKESSTTSTVKNTTSNTSNKDSTITTNVPVSSSSTSTTVSQYQPPLQSVQTPLTNNPIGMPASSGSQPTSTTNTASNATQTTQKNHSGEPSKPRKRPHGSSHPAGDKHPKKAEYHNEALFANDAKGKYGCIHCNKIPSTTCYRCQCTEPNTEKGKPKFKNNAGLSCGNCKHLPCKNCNQSNQYNEDKITKTNITKLKVNCPQGCKEKPILNKLNSHLQNECSNRRRPCKYDWIGCKEENAGQELKAHENDTSKHFDLAMSAILDLRKRVETLEEAGSDIQQISTAQPPTPILPAIQQISTAQPPTPILPPIQQISTAQPPTPILPPFIPM